MYILDLRSLKLCETGVSNSIGWVPGGDWKRALCRNTVSRFVSFSYRASGARE